MKLNFVTDNDHLIAVKMGLFKDIPKPTIEIYNKRKMPWETAVADAHQLAAGS